jgi:hypothetical protein
LLRWPNLQFTFIILAKLRQTIYWRSNLLSKSTVRVWTDKFLSVKTMVGQIFRRWTMSWERKICFLLNILLVIIAVYDIKVDQICQIYLLFETFISFFWDIGKLWQVLILKVLQFWWNFQVHMHFGALKTYPFFIFC